MSLTTIPKPTQIPVTVPTGILGAGKTTLLNGILSENHGQSRSASSLGQILEMEPDFLSSEHTSVSLTSDTPTDTQRFNVWIGLSWRSTAKTCSAPHACGWRCHRPREER
jgi:hypothetical protein